jgi:hypothetical protein
MNTGSIRFQKPEYQGIRSSIAVLLILLLAGCNLATAPQSGVVAPIPVVTLATATPQSALTPTPTLTATATNVSTPVMTPTLLVNNFTGHDSMLYLRDNPSTMGSVTAQVNPTAALQAIGRTADNQWLQVELASGHSGWILAGSVYIPVEIQTLPVTGQSDNARNVIILPPNLSENLIVYQLPNGTSLIEIGSLTPLRVEGQLADGSWVLVITNEGLQGWLPVDNIPVDLPENMPVVAPLPITPVPADTDNSNPDARVRNDAGGLRLRQLPTTSSSVLINMDAGTALTVMGRNSDSSWLLVEMREGYQGWAAAAYLDLAIDINRVAVIASPQPVLMPDLPTPENAPAVSFVGSGGARQIYLRGQQMGNRRNVFTTIGDSLSDTPHFLRPIAYGYDLRDYGYLLPTLQYFNADTGHGNAYNRRSFATNAGWSSFSVLDANSANPSMCQAGELPIACEYRLTKPVLALIMIGTNDAPAFSPEQYRLNLTRIIQISDEYGVIPVLSTLPPRAEFNDKILAYNQVIQQLANTYDIPLWDFYAAVATLPDSGFGPDGIHLSLPPNAPAATMDFTSDNLRYGTTMRNLTALQTLKAVLENIMY